MKENNELNIAFQTTIDYGGVGRFAAELIKSLAQKVQSITVFPTPISASEPTDHPYWETVPENVRIVPRESLPYTYIRDTRAFVDYDIVHVNYASFGMAAYLSNHLMGTPYVFTVHSSQDMDFAGRGAKQRLQEYWIERRLLTPLVGRTGTTVTVSEYNRRRLAEEYDIESEVVYHGISTAEYRGRDYDKADQGLTKNSVVLLAVGRFYPSKGMMDLINAFPQIREKTENKVELVVVGGGPQRAEVAERIANIGQSDIQLLEDISDNRLLDMYALADLFVLPSTSESFGIVYLEAMAAGMPVVYADAGAAPEVVADAGVSVPPNDPVSLADAVTALVDDGARRRALATTAKTRADQFTWENAADSYLTVYREAMAR